MNRPFEGGFKATSGISMAIYHHVGCPLALDQVHAQTKPSDYFAISMHSICLKPTVSTYLLIFSLIVVNYLQLFHFCELTFKILQ